MTTAIDPEVTDAVAEKDAFLRRMLRSAAGTFDIYTIYLGHRLGLYEALAAGDGLTPGELAERTGTQKRLVREWLEQQTVSGIVTVADESAPPLKREFSLSPGRAEVLTDRDSLEYLAPLARLLIGCVRPIDQLLGAFRDGGGVPFSAYGQDMRQGQGEINRAAFLQQLGPEWIPVMADVHERLTTDPPARVADIGCGVGYSSIGIAGAYPNARVDGFDLDAPSIEQATANAKAAGVADRVTFRVHDAGDPLLHGRYDLVVALECIHDMSDPVSALVTIRRLVGDRGAVLIVDERVAEYFTAAGTDVEWMMYGWSVLHCLPVSLADDCQCGGTGTVMRPATLRRYAEGAGFREVEILPIENYFFRFYRLRQ